MKDKQMDLVNKKLEEIMDKISEIQGIMTNGEIWKIRHPGNNNMVMTCKSFKEAMDKWFEGFNIPYKVVDGVKESHEESYVRVQEELKKE